MAKKISKKQTYKRCDKSCYFCGESDYELLDLHRIIEGADGGKYTRHNSLTVCALCHRKIHAEQIKIDRKYLSSTGKYVLHFWQNGEEHWR